jgi:hypothetical protein
VIEMSIDPRIRDVDTFDILGASGGSTYALFSLITIREPLPPRSFSDAELHEGGRREGWSTVDRHRQAARKPPRVTGHRQIPCRSLRAGPETCLLIEIVHIKPP